MGQIKFLDFTGLKHLTDKINTLKANIESPDFTGTPTAPTATIGTNTDQIATTAFVNQSFSWGQLGQEEE